MTALNEITNEVLNRLTNFGVVQGRTAWLAAAVDADDLTWQLDATTSVGEGIAEIESELVYFRQYDSSNSSVLVAPDGRGWEGTTPASHAKDTRISIEPLFPRRSIAAAVNATIQRAFPTIWGTSTERITIIGGKATYELPDTAQAVLSVRSQVWGSSGIWEPVRDYSFDGHADTTVYPSGKSITIPLDAYPGRPVQVSVKVKPSDLDDTMTDFTDCGLNDSARYAIILGTAADLVRFADPLRLVANSASADEFDTKRGYGTSTKIANDLESQFQRELMSETQRLRQLFPATIHRKRF